ncbi:hypothetical protein PPSIR1_32392 [Plesiocystis pacifica SIR-1]|uniref:Lipoprotein n=1 Tax=Plesiocystis pacifica SIR-1 TaxID=391625 RepID=A6G5L4_9BACT|nr:hypothetical protein PPSIR1_32392 [Plesiocystis pacifica SIR-1]
MTRAEPARGGRAAALVSATCVAALGCAPIDVESTVRLDPPSPAQEAAPVVVGGPQRVATDFRVEFIQLGPRLLVDVRELPRCAQARHQAVLRVETIERSSRGFVAWDFGLGTVAGGFAAFAFARPNAFGNRLIDDQGRVVYDNTAAWLTGGAFATLSAILLSAGVVNALRARDSVRYAEAREVLLDPPGACPDRDPKGEPASDRRLRLRLLDEGGEALELEAQTDASGRAAFVLPPWPGEAQGSVPAVLEIGVADADSGQWEERVPSFRLRAPWSGPPSSPDAHAGVADTREEGRE